MRIIALIATFWVFQSTFQSVFSETLYFNYLKGSLELGYPVLKYDFFWKNKGGDLRNIELTIIVPDIPDISDTRNMQMKMGIPMVTVGTGLTLTKPVEQVLWIDQTSGSNKGWQFTIKTSSTFTLPTINFTVNYSLFSLKTMMTAPLSRGITFPISDISVYLSDIRNQYLKNTTLINKDDSEIKKIAAEITKSSTNSLEAIQAISKYVFSRYYYLSGPLKSATQTNTSGTGDCDDLSILIAAFCRAVKIPARVNAGLSHDVKFSVPFFSGSGTLGSKSPGIWLEPGGHAYCEAYNGYEWIKCDPAQTTCGFGWPTTTTSFFGLEDAQQGLGCSISWPSTQSKPIIELGYTNSSGTYIKHYKWTEKVNSVTNSLTHVNHRTFASNYISSPPAGAHNMGSYLFAAYDDDILTGFYDNVIIVSGPRDLSASSTYSYSAQFTSGGNGVMPLTYNWKMFLYHNSGKELIGSSTTNMPQTLSAFAGTVPSLLPDKDWSYIPGTNKIYGEVEIDAILSDQDTKNDVYYFAMDYCALKTIQGKTYSATDSVREFGCQIKYQNNILNAGSRVEVVAQTELTIGVGTTVKSNALATFKVASKPS